MFRSLLGSFLLFGVASAATCDNCLPPVVEPNGDTLTTCLCDGVVENDFEVADGLCDDQVAIYRCGAIGPSGRSRVPPLIWLSACDNFKDSSVCRVETTEDVPPSCVSVEGNTLVFDGPPDGVYDATFPLPECECLVAVYQRGQLGSRSPPPHLLVVIGERFQIPGEECPPDVCEETPEDPCFRACGDVPGYDDMLGDTLPELPCKKPSRIIVKYTGAPCAAPEDECCGPSPVDEARLCQDQGKCECTGEAGPGKVTVTVQDKGGDAIGGAIEVTKNDCFEIGTDGSGPATVKKLSKCPAGGSTTTGPARALATTTANEVPAFLRSRELKSSGGGSGGGGGNCAYKFDSETTIQFGGQTMRFHTSCSQPVFQNMKIGAGTIHGLLYDPA